MNPILSGEMLKLIRQPGILFWGFLAVPLAALLVKLGLAGFVYLRMGQQAGGDVDVLLSAARSLSISGNSLGHLLLSLGGLAFALLVAAFGDMLLTVVFAVLQGQGLMFSAASLITFVAAFGIALLELAVLAALVALLVVLFRSMIAAVIPVFLLAIGSTVIQLYLGADAERLPLPAYAAQYLRDWLLAGGTPVAAAMGFAILSGWCLVLTAGGMALFARQQLAAE
jgi:ABC-2 type transport system permease protein